MCFLANLQGAVVGKAVLLWIRTLRWPRNVRQIPADNQPVWLHVVAKWGGSYFELFFNL